MLSHVRRQTKGKVVGFHEKVAGLVNFMSVCLVHGFPKVKSNVIPVVSLVFLAERSTEVGRLSEADCPPSCGGPHPVN